MIVAVASGKGGTGKTTVAVNLALALGGPLQFLDCDVEEPNAHLFLNPQITEAEQVHLLVPEVDEQRCTACGACGRACRYHAIVSLKTKPLVFPELCHGCGNCTLACKAGAIRETPRTVGVIERGRRNGIRFAHGRLNVGEAMAGPVIRALRRTAERSPLTLIDAPPGASCPVVASVRASDFVVLVTEPTPFGLNDLALAADLVRELNLPFGVVINRSDIGNQAVRDYCRRQGIPLLVEIPEDRRVAEAYSRGEPAIQAVPAMRESFERLYEAICRQEACSAQRCQAREDSDADV